jgi:hypothetical protein
MGKVDIVIIDIYRASTKVMFSKYIKPTIPVSSIPKKPVIALITL